MDSSVFGHIIMRIHPIIWSYVEYQEKTHLELAKAGLRSGVVLFSSGLDSGILLFFFSTESVLCDLIN